MIRPIGDKVLVLEDEQPEKIGGIYLPPGVDDQTWECMSGEVVGLGEGTTHIRRWNVTGAGGAGPVFMDGAIVTTLPDVCLGDRVIMDPWMGEHFEYEGSGYRLLDRDKVLLTGGDALNPVGGTLLVKRLEPDGKTEGGLYLPDEAQGEQLRATVIAVGPGRMLDTGERAPMRVCVGDKVIMNKKVGTPVRVGGLEYWAVTEPELLAIVEDE